MRYVRLLPFVLLSACSCASTPSTARVSDDIFAIRMRTLERDLRWTSDTLPILRFNPPLGYYALRERIEKCSGLTREGWPTFFQANVYPLPPMRNAFYAFHGDNVVFAMGSAQNERVIMHELLHWLTEHLIPPAPLDETDEEALTRTHPNEYFVVRCGQIVDAR